MNVYIIDEFVSSQKNGIGTFMKELIFSLQQLELNICIIEFNSNEENFCIKKGNGIKKICFPPFPDGRFPRYYKIIDKFFRLYIGDSIETIFLFNHSPCENLLRTTREAFPLSRIVFTIHNMGWASRLMGDLEKFKSIISKWKQKRITEKYGHILNYFDEEKRMYNIVDKVICLSQDTRNFLINTYKIKQSKIHLIPNGIRDTFSIVSKKDTISIRRNKYISQNEKIILYVGRLTEIKGCLILLNCFRHVLEKYPNCRLVLAGSMHNSLPILEICNSFVTKVSFTGLISHAELRQWYQIADIGVIPSFTEQSSYTAIEMMMHGLAIVAANGYGLNNMFENFVNALTVDIDRKDNKKYESNFAHAILKILQDESLSLKLKKGARNIFHNKYEQKHMQEKYKNLFDSFEKYE